MFLRRYEFRVRADIVFMLSSSYGDRRCSEEALAVKSKSLL